MPKVYRFAAAVLALGLGTALTPADDKKDVKPVSDADFVLKAGSGGMFEVESSKVAKEAAKSEDVKKFADQMIADHGKANKELEAAAKKAGLSAPAKLTDDHQKLLDKVKAAKGANFDATYMDAQVKSHEEAVSLFTNAAQSLKDPGLKSFAEKTLPVIKEHYDHAKKHAKGGKDR